MENGSITHGLFLNYGGSEKSSFEMDAVELAEAARQVLARVRERAFSKGIPVYYEENGQIVAEYADGKKKPVNQNDLADVQS